MPERLIVVAHGTASPAGRATTGRLVDDVRAERPTVEVELCFLDVVEPRLPALLAELDKRPAVLVPVLLSTGYHVQSDIPAAVAAYPHVRVARHLGPHPLLTDALTDRLAELPGEPATVVLVGAGSSRPEAAAELAEAGRLLGERLHRRVDTTTVGGRLREALAGRPAPLHVATYLLTEGQFHDTVRTTAADAAGTPAAGAGPPAVADPIGTHPALARLMWQRYDEVVSAARVL